MSAGVAPRVAWAELFPDEFENRLREFPVAYLPLGLCEPHGPFAALGLDLLKAEGICAMAARRFGGIVAPSLGYHIHESGYHARWLEEVVGEVNPRMTSVPPFALLHFFLYQLRAVCNAGFRGLLVLTGHAGGNERDLRKAAQAFSRRLPLAIEVRTDAELASPRFVGDHAGRFEISQLMYLRPELVDGRLHRTRGAEPEQTGLHGTRFALGETAGAASAQEGEEIVETILHNMAELVTALATGPAPPAHIDYANVQAVWQDLRRTSHTWTTARPKPDQAPVSDASQWKRYERV